MKENNIEKDIKIAERFIKSIKTDKEYKKEGWHGYFNEEIVKLARILEHILKELKRFENMYEAEHQIHLVRNEQLDRKQKAIIKCNELENENKELKKENEELKNNTRKNENELEFDIDCDWIALQKILDESEKSNEYISYKNEKWIKEKYCIPIQKVKDIIDRIDYDIKKTKEIISKNTNIYASYRKNDYQIVRLRAMNTKSLDIKNRLQKLLESKK